MSVKEIAKAVGTSVATVSRVLNNAEHKCHDRELADRIWKEAAKQQYVPNQSARNLRKGEEKKEDFCVDIYFTRPDAGRQDMFFVELFQYIKQELLENHCVLGEVFHTSDIVTWSEAKEQYTPVPYKTSAVVQKESAGNTLAFVSGKQNTGLVILGKCPSHLIPVLKKRYEYLVGIDRNPTEYEYDEVVCDGAVAAEKAVEYLIALGHRKIVYIGDCTYESRYIGYYQTLLKHHIPLNHQNVYPTNQTMEEGQATVEKIIASGERPTAIFCANDMTALGAIQALKKARIKGYFPSVIGIDNINDAQTSEPLLTTIHIPRKEMGHLALALLLDRKKGKHKEYVRIELPCRLVERESCYLC